MLTRRNLLPILLVSATLIGGYTLLTGCESKPTAPVYDNPFDPENGSDPLQVSAVAEDTTVTVSWTQPQGYDIVSYDVYYSVQFSTGFSKVGSVEHTDDDENSFDHTGVEPTSTHYYKVKAVNEDGQTTLISAQVAASAVTKPLLTIGDGTALTAARHVTLSVAVTMGDFLRLADNADFTDADTVAAVSTGEIQQIAWDLGPATANGETKSVYVQAFTGVVRSETASADVQIDFTPAFSAVGDPETVAMSWLSLELETAGVDSMRFALSEEDLAQQPWLPVAETVPYFPLVDSANPQVIYGDFLGHFGFTNQSTWTAVPDLLTDVSFSFLLPADHVSSESRITVVNDATARYMRFSESLDFNQVTWIAYQDTTQVQLSAGAGRKVIYAQYRNDWAESAILNDFVDYVTQPLDLDFLAPAEGSVLRARQPLQIRGLYREVSGGAEVDSIKIDTADGAGFRDVDAAGTYWFYLWDVPAVTGDTETVLRARAWAGEDSVTAWLNVTISDLLIDITGPAPDSEVTGGEATVIEGTAQPFLAGAAIDSVVVTAAGNPLSVSGTNDWSANWTPADVTATTPATITATAYAGGESVADTVQVSIIVAEEE